MLTNDTIVKVTNRSNSQVGYSIPEMHITRYFAKNETKQLTVQEIRALSQENGGRALLKHHLVLDNEALANELIYGIEPEYFYTEKDIVELLEHGSLEQLLDALDFGPQGVHDLIKAKAVELEVPDIRKRNAILEKTGFNVTSVIENNKQSDTAPVVEGQTRRAAPIGHSTETAEAPARRATPKYKVTSTSNN